MLFTVFHHQVLNHPYLQSRASRSTKFPQAKYCKCIRIDIDMCTHTHVCMYSYMYSYSHASVLEGCGGEGGRRGEGGNTGTRNRTHNRTHKRTHNRTYNRTHNRNHKELTIELTNDITENVEESCAYCVFAPKCWTSVCFTLFRSEMLNNHVFDCVSAPKCCIVNVFYYVFAHTCAHNVIKLINTCVVWSTSYTFSEHPCVNMQHAQKSVEKKQCILR